MRFAAVLLGVVLFVGGTILLFEYLVWGLGDVPLWMFPVTIVYSGIVGWWAGKYILANLY